jgi:uncharacterized protein
MRNLSTKCMGKKENKMLWNACEEGDLEALVKAVDAGADLESTDEADFTALAIATKEGQLHLIFALLKYGAKVTMDVLTCANMSADSNDIIRSTLGRAQVMQAEPDVEDMNKMTQNMFMGAFKGDAKMVEESLEMGTDPNIDDGIEQSPLRLACRHGHKNVVEALLTGGAEIDRKNMYGWTALMDAVVGGQEKMVKLLLEKGADKSIGTDEGQTALGLAQQTGEEKIEKLLA